MPPGNARKETLDGFYADGTVTITGSAAIYADANEDKYDINANIPFPSLDDPYYRPRHGNHTMADHRDFLNAFGLTLPVNEISDNTPAFSVSDATGQLSRLGSCDEHPSDQWHLSCRR